MTAINRRSTLKLAGAGLACAAMPGPLIAETVETFSGALDLPSGRLRLRLVLSGVVKATLYSVDQGNAAIPASSLEIKGDTLKIGFSAIDAAYVAKRSGDVLNGTFSQNGSAFPLQMVRGDSFALDPMEALFPGPLTPAMLAAARRHFGTPAIGAMWQRAAQAPQILVDGLRAADRDERVTPQDRWHLGSITKSMTATLAARAVEAGLIGWDDRVGAVLGNVAPDMNPVYRDVTLADLLCHHGGLQPNIDIARFADFRQDSGADIIAERQRWARLALSQSPASAPRNKMVYSNNGFIVAGAMLEAKSGKSWETMMQTMLFTPLGLDSGGFGPPDRGYIGAEPRGHAIAGNGTRITISLDNPAALGPAGRVAMNLADIARYLAAHRDRPLHFLQKASWEALHRPRFDGRDALGWIVGNDGSLWHNGSNTAWYAEVLVDRSANSVAAIVSNDSRMEAGQPGRLLKAAALAAKSS